MPTRTLTFWIQRHKGGGEHVHDMWMHMHPTALEKAVTYEPPWNPSELILFFYFNDFDAWSVSPV